MSSPDSLVLHPDRLLPPEPGVRAIARRLYDAVRDLPLISPHGHIDPDCCSTPRRPRPLLERCGTHTGFHLVVFTADMTVWSRELAPLAGFYPSVYLGVPWWFLDATAVDLVTGQPLGVFKL